jgi:hypothetical protein
VRAGRFFGDGRSGKGANEGKGDQGLLHGFLLWNDSKTKKEFVHNCKSRTRAMSFF